jgi:Flp pilus assembly protein TadD
LRAARIAGITLLATLAAFVLIAAQAAPEHLDRALAAQRQLAADHPDDPAVLNDLGNLLALAGETRAALDAYGKAVALAPEDPGPHFNYGLLLAESGERRAAFKQFRKVVELEPRHAWAYYELGSIYDAWGLERRARKAYARSFTLDPRLADPRYNASVLDNHQATAAMLMAWKPGVSAVAAAPRDYVDPARIAALMIDLPKKKAEGPEKSDQEATGEGEPGSGEAGSGGYAHLAEPAPAPPADRRSATSSDSAPAPVESPAESADASPRVLTPSDLRSSGSVNQVVPQGGAAHSPRARSYSAPTVHTRPGTVPPRPRFVPRSGSTGQLEPRLLPPAPDEASIAG